jgi:hypothetical protein
MHRQTRNTTASVGRIPGTPVRSGRAVREPRGSGAHARSRSGHDPEALVEDREVRARTQHARLALHHPAQHLPPGKAARDARGARSRWHDVRTDGGEARSRRKAAARRRPPAFAPLPDVEREAPMLVGGEGFSHGEAAALSGCAVGTIRSRANRGRGRLAHVLRTGAGEHPAISDHGTVALLGRKPWA